MNHAELILLWCLFGSVPLAVVIELAAAMFSKRVRRYIVEHPVAHIVLFLFALVFILFLFPGSSKKRQMTIETPNKITAAKTGERFQFTSEHIVLLVAIATRCAEHVASPGLAEFRL